MNEAIKKAVLRALAALGLEITDVVIEHPTDIAHGDYATSVALQYAKQAGKAPRALAEKLVAALGSIEGVGKIEIAGAGFINFTLASAAVAASLRNAVAEDMWGSSAMKEGRRIMVEYTDPNPFKEFHIGHLMSNAIGESISRLLQYSGADIVRANYQGDVGPHVAKAIWGIRQLGVDPRDSAALGRAYATGAQAFETDKEAQAQITAINTKVYDKSDAAINELYAAGRAASLAHFEELYRILDTTFDCYFFESESAPKGIALVRAHPDVFEESDGAVVFKGEKVGLHTRVFITSLGLPTYEAKDLGLLQLKREAGTFDESITITASEQSDYFKVVLAAAQSLAEVRAVAAHTRHITHGMMRLPTGKMSSRTGEVVTGESLLMELTVATKARASESHAQDPERLARDVAVAAIKYQILKQSSGKDIVFDKERALSLEGDSGPYVQYAYARTCALAEKAKEQHTIPSVDDTIEPTALTRLLHRFPEVVERATILLEPHIITTYLVEIAGAFNAWYAQEQILDGTPEAAHKLAIVQAVGRTLKNGLWLLGIRAPERM